MGLTYLKMVRMVNFMLYIFITKKKKIIPLNDHEYLRKVLGLLDLWPLFCHLSSIC